MTNYKYWTTTIEFWKHNKLQFYHATCIGAALDWHHTIRSTWTTGRMNSTAYLRGLASTPTQPMHAYGHKGKRKPEKISHFCNYIINFQIFKAYGFTVSVTKRGHNFYHRTHGVILHVKKHFCKAYSLTHHRECENTLNYVRKRRRHHHRTTNLRVQEYKVIENKLMN